MSIKLEKIAAEREKARRKRDEWDERMKEWDLSLIHISEPTRP